MWAAAAYGLPGGTSLRFAADRGKVGGEERLVARLGSVLGEAEVGWRSLAAAGDWNWADCAELDVVGDAGGLGRREESLLSAALGVGMLDVWRCCFPGWRVASRLGPSGWAETRLDAVLFRGADERSLWPAGSAVVVAGGWVSDHRPVVGLLGGGSGAVGEEAEPAGRSWRWYGRRRGLQRAAGVTWRRGRWLRFGGGGWRAG